VNSQSQLQSHQIQAISGGSVWHQLRSEREDVCQLLLQNAWSIVIDTPVHRQKRDRYLQARLRLIDQALDRLMAGTYGDCARCGRWIEDTKLHVDPAFPFCRECQHTQNHGH